MAPQLQHATWMISSSTSDLPSQGEVHIEQVRMSTAAPHAAGPRQLPISRPATAYLALYNVLSASLRIAILLRTIQLWSIDGTAAVWDELNTFARWTETLTVLEVIHAAAGLVRSSPATTALQVAGRNIIVGHHQKLPGGRRAEWAYPNMLATWNAADVVRYTHYFAVGERPGRCRRCSCG